MRTELPSYEEVKAALVDAHRRGDWEEARRLSQLRQRVKPSAVCPVCGAAIKPKNRTCNIHVWRRVAMQRQKKLNYGNTKSQ